MSAVEQNLALLRDRMQQEKRAEQQQLSRRTTDARARIALVAHASATSRGTRALNPEPVMLLNRSPRARGGDGAGTAVQDVGVDDVTGELADDSVQKVMMKRLGEGGLSGLAAPAAAAVAEAAISSASRQKINDDRERADRAALAEVVARQSALTLEARAVIAGGGRGCAQLLQACSCTLPRFVVPSAISLTRLQ
jgi:predicted phage gp36 major capsid-like protein